jgi:hypothetical protein
MPRNPWHQCDCTHLEEDLRPFWEQPGKRFGTSSLDGWIRRAEASGIRMLQQMAGAPDETRTKHTITS